MKQITQSFLAVESPTLKLITVSQLKIKHPIFKVFSSL